MPELRGFVGACKAGKTYTMQCLAAAAARQGAYNLAVLDLNAEWPERKCWAGVAGLDITRARSIQSGAAAIAEKRPVVIVDAGEGADHVAPHAQSANDLAAACIASPAAWLLLLPEAHTSAREGYPLPRHLGEIAHRHRHPGVRTGCWWDTQHLSEVSKDLMRASSTLYLFGGSQFGDGGRLKRMGGQGLVDAVAKCGQRAANGEPGWHVRFRPLDPSGPHVPRRL